MFGSTPIARIVPVLVLAVCLGGLSTGCSKTAASPSTASASEYRVGPPDVLTITILPEPVIEREAVVRPDGMISVDLIGDIPAGGRTVSEIATDIESRIGRFKRDARATVALTAALSNQVTVLGEVQRPTTFPLSRQTRLIEALGTVGGSTLLASKTNIKIVRQQDGQTIVYKANLKDIQNGDLSSNILLQGGDFVYVPPSTAAAIGYAIQGVLFPFQQLLGFGTQVSTKVFTGGVF